MVELTTIELDEDLGEGLISAVIASQMADIILDVKSGKVYQDNPVDVRYYQHLCEAADVILRHYTTDDLYHAYLEYRGDDDE
jgi:hypothetical protein